MIVNESSQTESVAAETPATDGAQSEISVLDLLITVAERKRTVLIITCVFIVGSVIFSLVVPSRYTASVVLLPPQQNQTASAALASQLGNLGAVSSLAGGSLGLKSPNDMYVAMFRSRTVEDALIQRFGLMQQFKCPLLSDCRKAFEQHSTVAAGTKDNLITVTFWDKDPHRAADLANGYVDQFRKLTAHLAITEASQRRLFFEQQLEEAKNNLADAEEALKVTEQQTGLIELNSQAKVLIESAASLRAQIVMKEMQIHGMQTYATGENAQLIEAQRELDSLRGQLAKLEGAEGSSDSLMIPRGKVTQSGLEYGRKLRNVKYYETIFEILSRQYESAKLDEAKQGAVIQVVDPAIVPDKRSFPRRGLIVIAATVVGFLIGIFVVLLQGAFSHLKERPEYAKVAHFFVLIRRWTSSPNVA